MDEYSVKINEVVVLIEQFRQDRHKFLVGTGSPDALN